MRFISEIKLLSLMESHPKYLFQNTITVKNNPARKYIYTGISLYIVFLRNIQTPFKSSFPNKSI